MATLVLEQKKTPNFFSFALILIVAFASIGYGLHAVEKHGSDALIVRDCIHQKGAIGTWINPETGKKALICQVNDTLFGIMIMKGKFEITSFLKNKMTKIDQVFRYLANQGYVPE